MFAGESRARLRSPRRGLRASRSPIPAVHGTLPAPCAV